MAECESAFTCTSIYAFEGAFSVCVYVCVCVCVWGGFLPQVISSSECMTSVQKEENDKEIGAYPLYEGVGKSEGRWIVTKQPLPLLLKKGELTEQLLLPFLHT